MTTRTVATRLMLDIGGYMGPLKVAAAGTRQFGGEFGKAATQGSQGMDKLSRGALIAGGGILAGFGLAINSAMKFDKEMSAVGSAAGSTGKQLEALRYAAMKAGADTAFSATEAAQAEEELAKAGVSVKDILGGGLQGALALAAAGQIDVADSAAIAATAMTQFRLSGDKVPHIADLLSAAANKAQGGVGDLGMALKQGGLVASQFGLTIEETTGGLAAFAKAGLIGSDAGTSLKTMLLALANPGEKTAALMAKLGINAYDAKGNFVGLAGLAGILRDKLSGLTQAQRDQALAQIFGADATRAANVLYRNGAEGINKWTDEVNDAGNASRTAAAKMDNLAGDLEQLKGSLETALIQTGSQGTGVLRVLAQAGTNAANGFMGMPGPIRETGTALLLLVGAALAAGGAYGTLAPKVRLARTELEAMGPAGAKANAMLGSTAKWAGRAVLAFAALEIVNTVAEQFAAAAPDVGRLSKELERFSETGRVSGEMTRVFDKDLGRLGDAVKFVRNSGGIRGVQNAMAFEPGFIAAQSWSVTAHVKALQSLDEALASMVASGHGSAAASAVRGVGLSAKESAEFLPKYSGALGDAKDATATAANSLATAGGQARIMAGGMESAVKEAGSLKDALSGLNDVNIGAAEAGIAWRQSIMGMTKALQDNKSAWGENTAAGLANKQEVIDRIKVGQAALATQHAETLAANGGADSARAVAIANAQATTSHRQMRAAMINTAVAAGIGRGAVTALVDSLFRIPANTPAHVSTPGATTATAQVAALKAQIAALRNKVTVVSQRGALEAANEVLALQHRIDVLQGKTVTIATHYITSGSRIGQTSQGSGGNHRGEFRWGGIHHAAAGRLDAHMVDTPTVLYGERETGGEAFIPRLGDPARSRKILDTAASWLGGTVSYGAYAGALTGGGSSSTTVVHQTINVRTNADPNEVVRVIRKAVRIDGRGNVQTALGR